MMKKLILGWLGLCAIAGSWALITGNTSEEAAFENELVDICEDAFDENEELLRAMFFDLVLETEAGFTKLNIEYDDDIEPNIEAKRGIDRRELNISCQQKLVSKYDFIEPWAVIMVHVNKDGDPSYNISEYDIYDGRRAKWISQLKGK